MSWCLRLAVVQLGFSSRLPPTVHRVQLTNLKNTPAPIFQFAPDSNPKPNSNLIQKNPNQHAHLSLHPNPIQIQIQNQIYKSRAKPKQHEDPNAYPKRYQTRSSFGAQTPLDSKPEFPVSRCGCNHSCLPSSLMSPRRVPGCRSGTRYVEWYCRIVNTYNAWANNSWTN